MSPRSQGRTTTNLWFAEAFNEIDKIREQYHRDRPWPGPAAGSAAVAPIVSSVTSVVSSVVSAVVAPVDTVGDHGRCPDNGGGTGDRGVDDAAARGSSGSKHVRSLRRRPVRLRARRRWPGSGSGRGAISCLLLGVPRPGGVTAADQNPAQAHPCWTHGVSSSSRPRLATSHGVL